MNEKLINSISTIIQTELLDKYSERDIEKIIEITKNGINHKGTTSYQEAVELNSIDKGVSRSIKYIIKFKILDLLEYLSSAAVTIAGAMTMPWVGIIGLLILIKQLYSSSKIVLTENQCKVIWVMYKIHIKEYEGELTKSNIVKCLKSELIKYKASEMSDNEINKSLDSLKELGIIDDIGEEWEFTQIITVNTELAEK